MTLAAILLATFLSGVVAVWISALVLFVAKADRLPRLVDFAVGTLLGTALLDLLPEALRTRGEASVREISAVVLGGLFAFLVLERGLAWRHCHEPECPRHGRAGPRRATVPMILFGDGLHNFVDGVVIAAAFTSSTRLGIATTFAVAAHELPQELGDIGVLVRSGLRRSSAILWNSLSALVAMLGALAGYAGLELFLRAKPYALAISASSFLYIALADLVPSLHDDRPRRPGSTAQILLVAAGIGASALAHVVSAAD